MGNIFYGVSVTPSGSNPLVFGAGLIAASTEARITYQTTAPPAKS